MIIKYTNLIGCPVVEIENQTRVGKICDFILANDFSLKAIIVSYDSIFAQTKGIVSCVDIMSVLKDGIIVSNKEVLSTLDELPRIKELYKAKLFGINQKVSNQSGKTIGSVYDYLIDSKTLSTTKLYVKKLLDERIIPIEKIVSFEGKKIIIRDDMVLSNIEQTVLETAN